MKISKEMVSILNEILDISTTFKYDNSFEQGLSNDFAFTFRRYSKLNYTCRIIIYKSPIILNIRLIHGKRNFWLQYDSDIQQISSLTYHLYDGYQNPFKWFRSLKIFIKPLKLPIIKLLEQLKDQLYQHKLLIS